MHAPKNYDAHPNTVGGVSTQDFDHISEKGNQPVYLNYMESEMPLTDNGVQSTILKWNFRLYGG